MRYKIEEPEDSSGILRPEMVHEDKHICVWYPGEEDAGTPSVPHILMRGGASSTWIWHNAAFPSLTWQGVGDFNTALSEVPLSEITVYDSPAEAYADLAEYYRKREG